MAHSDIFEWVCDALEQRTELERLEARGTVRLSLRGAGLDMRNLTVAQMLVVLDKVLPGELATRAIDGADAICTEIALGLEQAGIKGDVADTTPEDVFRRLAAN